MNFVETAETAALGRALKDAGFGTQFCDVAIPNDESAVDASINLSFETIGNETMNSDNESVPAKLSGSKIETVSNPAENEERDEKPVTPAEASKPKQKETLVLTDKMPFDELLSKMTLEYAKSVKVDYGYDIGKTLGELAMHKPKSIQFHADRSSNNLIKAAAQFLLNAAKDVA